MSILSWFMPRPASVLVGILAVLVASEAVSESIVIKFVDGSTTERVSAAGNKLLLVNSSKSLNEIQISGDVVGLRSVFPVSMAEQRLVGPYVIEVECTDVDSVVAELDA